MIVDSHQHLWDLEKVEYPWLVPAYGPLYRTFTPAELEPQLVAAGVDRTVLVQAANSYADTDSMLAHAAEHDWIGAVVGWVPLEDAGEAARVLDGHYLADPWFRGVRHLNHEEADPDWLVRPAVIDGLKVLEERGLVYEVVAVHPLHLGHVPALARACPRLAIVVDHLAKPPIASGDYAAWKADLRAAAEHPNVHAKVSGLNTAADWQTWSAATSRSPSASRWRSSGRAGSCSGATGRWPSWPAITRRSGRRRWRSLTAWASRAPTGLPSLAAPPPPCTRSEQPRDAIRTAHRSQAGTPR